MRNNFCSIIQTIYTSNPYTIDRLCSTLLYAYDCGLSKRTFLVESDTNKDKSLKIKMISGVKSFISVLMEESSNTV